MLFFSLAQVSIDAICGSVLVRCVGGSRLLCTFARNAEEMARTTAAQFLTALRGDCYDKLIPASLLPAVPVV
jgi:hypothetical protein